MIQLWPWMMTNHPMIGMRWNFYVGGDCSRVEHTKNPTTLDLAITIIISITIGRLCCFGLLILIILLALYTQVWPLLSVWAGISASSSSALVRERWAFLRRRIPDWSRDNNVVKCLQKRKHFTDSSKRSKYHNQQFCTPIQEPFDNFIMTILRRALTFNPRILGLLKSTM